MCPTLRSRHATASGGRELQIDRCWGIPVLGAITTLIICFPASYMGLLFVFIVEDYGYSRAHASWPQNVLIVGSQLSGLAVGELQQHFTIANIAVMSSMLAAIAIAASAFSRHVAWVSVTLGALYGLGMGMFLTCVCFSSLMWFRKYRGTAVSLIFVAWSVSGLYAPPVLTLLHELYGLPGSLLISGAVLLHAVPLSLLLRYPWALKLDFLDGCSVKLWCGSATARNRQAAKKTQLLLVEQKEGVLDCSGDDDDMCTRKTPTGTRLTRHRHSVTEEQESSGTPSSLRNRGTSLSASDNTESGQSRGVLKFSMILFRSPAFYAFVVAAAVGEYSQMAFAVTVVDYATDKGIELNVAAHLVIYGAMGQILGRLILVPISDCVPSARSLLFSGAFAIEALCAAAMPHVFSILAVVVLRVIEAGIQGAAIAIRGVLLAHYVGVETMPTCTGLFGLALIPVSLSSASIIGLFRDHMGSYDGFYRFLAAVNTAVAVGLCVFFACDWRGTQRQRLNRRKNAFPTEPRPGSTELPPVPS